MVVGNVVEEESTSPTKERSIHSRQSSTEESPLLTSIMGDGRVRVVQVGQHDNPYILRQSIYGELMSEGTNNG